MRNIKKKRFNKKGAFSLSVKAIIILIFAVTVLMLIIGFVKNMWEKISNRFEGEIERTQHEFIDEKGNICLSMSKGLLCKYHCENCLETEELCNYLEEYKGEGSKQNCCERWDSCCKWV